MILVDTSVWIDHLKVDDLLLSGLLASRRVLTHTYVICEISLASLSKRAAVLGALQDLPRVTMATADETYYLIEKERLFNQGIGFVDASLLASARLQPGVALWTRDKRLNAVATALGLRAALAH